MTDWTPEQVAQLRAVDGKRMSVRTTTPVFDVDGMPLGVEVEELPGTIHTTWGEPGWPEHLDATS